MTPETTIDPSDARVLWLRRDGSGHEAARLRADDGGWLLSGVAVFADRGAPCRLAYTIRCDARWNTRSVQLDGWLGRQAVALAVLRDADGRWTADDLPQPALDGCIDIDLEFSPLTNTLPIRRLALGDGEGADVRAAWLRVPGLSLQPLEQRYQRHDVSHYRYESRGGAFVAELEVNAAGLVLDYPGGWRAEAAC